MYRPNGDIVMDAGDGTHRVIESDAIRALIGYVEQRDGTPYPRDRDPDGDQRAEDEAGR